MAALPSTLQAARRRYAQARARRRAERSVVCVVGPGKAFLSGMTYHSYGLISALDEHGPTTAVLLRNLVPRRWYPGAERVGADLSHLRLPPDVRRAERLDWWWFPGLFEATWLLVRRPPAVLVVQWWSAAVWHSELALVLVARALGARVVVEVHEVVDSAEARHPVGRWWAGHVGPLLLDRADKVIVHSEADRELVRRELGVRRGRTELVPEPVFDAYDLGTDHHDHLSRPADPDGRAEIDLLFFGTIRPYKGLEDLVVAFDHLAADPDGPRWRLTVVGETWEGWDEPARRLARSPHASRITFVNRYVDDEEVHRHFAAADLVVLPYHRSSTSGPLLVAMSYGLPVVVTRVGGLPEAVDGYAGAVLVEPHDVGALAEGITEAAALVGQVHEADRTWADVAADHEDLYRRLGVTGRTRGERR